MRSNRGFTLIEVLITLTLFAMLVTGGLAALSAGTRSAAKADHYNAMVARGQGALQLIAADLRAAVAEGDFYLISLDAENGGFSSDTIDFIAATPPRLDNEDPYHAGRCEVGYYIENDPDTEMQWLVRREDPSPDDDELEGGAISQAGPYVQGLNFLFYDGLLWQSGWIDEEGFPLAVEIEVIVVDEDEQEKPLTLRTSVPIMARGRSAEF